MSVKSCIKPTVRPASNSAVSGVGGGAADPLVFHGITFDTDSGDSYDAYEMLGVKTGTGDLTEARASTIYVPDHEDVFRSFGSGEAAYKGGRVVTNHARSTDVLDSATWTAGSTLTVTPGATDPEGGATAYTLTNTSGTTQILRDVGLISDTSRQVRFSSWVRRRTGSGTVAMYTGASSSAVNVIQETITSSWQRIAATVATPDGSNNERIGFYMNTLGDEIDIWHPQFEDVTGQADQSPAEYIENTSTTAAATKVFANENGNSVVSNVVTEATGSALASAPWVQAQPALTNSITYSRDLTNAAWSETAGTANDLVTNGDFATDTDWTKGTGWSIAAGVASCDGTQTGSSLLYQSAGIAVGVVYKCTFTISNYSAGSVQIGCLTSAYGSVRAGNGTYVEYITAVGAGSAVIVKADADFVGDIDDVQVWEAVAQYDATGMQGDANGASTLTDDDGASVESTAESISVTDDSNTHVARIFVDKDADTSRFPLFTLAHSGGTGVSHTVALNTSTGAVAESGTGSSDVRDAGSWWELSVALANNGTGNTTSTLTLAPANAASLTVTPAAATTGSIIVGNVELHLNKTIAQVRGSGPIFTSGSAVSTTATDLSFDDANHDDTQGAWYAEFQKFVDSGSSLLGYEGIVGTSNSQIGAQLVFRDTAPYNYLMTDDGSNRSVANGGVTAETTKKVAMAYGDGLRCNNDGSWSTATAYDGGFGTIGSIKVAVSNMITGPTLIRNIRRYDQSYADAQTTIDGLMA